MFFLRALKIQFYCILLLLVSLLVSIADLEYLSLVAPSKSLLIHLSLRLCCPINYVVKSLNVSVFSLFLFCLEFIELPQCRNWTISLILGSLWPLCFLICPFPHFLSFLLLILTRFMFSVLTVSSILFILHCKYFYFCVYEIYSELFLVTYIRHFF